MFSAFGIDSVAGGLFEMDRNESMAEDSWRRGQENARIANEFTERMANTAHQRAVTDLTAAGLNPILSATKGGASSGQGAMSQAPQQAPAPNFSKIFSPTVQSENDNIQMDTRLKDAQRNHTSQMWNTSRAQEGLTNEQEKTQKELTREAHHRANSASAIEKGNKLEGEINEGEWGRFFRYLDRIRGTSGAIRDIK